MTVPSLSQSWTFTLNNRITFVSLNDTMARFLYGNKNFLVATMGYTVKYTCDGTTGPSSSSDHTDRWSSSANATTRGANTTSANSFAVLTDGNGADICLSYVGATDDVARISYSPGGLYTPAGTATNTPTATDEQVCYSGTSLIGSTASADRLWNAMSTSDKKMWRTIVFRSSALVGVPIMIEKLNSRTTVPYSPAMWGMSLAYSNWINWIGSSTTGPVARVNGVNVTSISGMVRGAQSFLTNGGLWQNTKTELQGTSGYPIRPISIGSQTSGMQGPLGYLYDLYTGRNPSTDGNVYGSNNWITSSLGMMFPWDGSTAPTIS